MKNKGLIQSFKNAFNGIYHAAVSERNMKIHICFVVIIILTGIICKIDYIRWIILFFHTGLVIICELINTSIEKLTDMVTNEYSDEAKKVKDISAAAVLVSAIIAVIVGIIVFYQPIRDLLKF